MTLLGFLPLVLAASPADEAAFETHVRPVLVESCVRCHGPAKASGGLRVDSRAALLAGGESGPAVVPGKPDASRLMHAVRRVKGTEAMPPDKALAPSAVAALDRWVAAGAPWPAAAAPVAGTTHWAFRPVRAVTPPAADTLNPIDAFLAAGLRAKGLTPLGPADPRVLVRRMTFDLTGLPPTPAGVDEFVRDATTDRPAAVGRLIDRLLASPAYGEKWGRRWLDVVRYADTAGETADFPVPDAWRYRNYVIAAFNADKPYTEFLTEQLAGDVLAARLPADAPATRHAELVTATGYLAVARRFGFDVAKDHFLTIEDTIDTLGKSVLGLTIACARCHDHKYDPVSAADYYALYGIFESTKYPNPGCEKTKVPADLVALRSGGTSYAVQEGAPHDAQLHKRGDPETRGPAVPRRFPTVLGGQPLPAGAGSGRLELAGWLTDPANPLTARVMVNRVWQGHFGRGLVETPNDFGTRGSPPTHPDLLDWLAARFVRSGWSVKALHRLILTSAAYQRSSGPGEPTNTHLGRFDRRRLDAEEIRDALLAVSGDLDPSPGGPHPFPAVKTWGFTQHAPFSAVYDTDRRSVYLMTQRIKRHPFLALFDGPDPNASSAVRTPSTVPTQALYFLNDPFVHARADRLAARLTGPPDERLDQACRLLYGRPASAVERDVAGRFLAAGGTWPGWVRVLFGSNEFVYVD